MDIDETLGLRVVRTYPDALETPLPLQTRRCPICELTTFPQVRVVGEEAATARGHVLFLGQFQGDKYEIRKRVVCTEHAQRYPKLLGHLVTTKFAGATELDQAA